MYRRKSIDVVGVGVGDENRGSRPLLVGQRAQDLLRYGAGINDDGLAVATSPTTY